MNDLLKFEKDIVRNNYWPFFGCFMQQTPNAVLSLNRLLNVYNFTNIIELGTHDGGLSMLFAMYCMLSRIPSTSEDPSEPSLCKNHSHHKSAKRFYTFDIVVRDKNRSAMLIDMGTHFGQLDFLKDNKSIEFIRSIIQKPGKTLLLCDGGDKKLEFSLYASSLKPGDIIMTHDWAKNEKAHLKNIKLGIWHGWESRWEDGPSQEQKFGLKDACKKYGIEQIHAEEFDKAVWFCGIKK